METDDFGPLTSAGEGEDDLGKAGEGSVEVEKSNEELREQLRQLREEMENMKTAVSFSEVAKQEEIQEIERKCEQDILSLRRIMKDAIQQATQSASEKLHQEKTQWQQEQEKLQQEVAELRSRLVQGERDGFLSSVARSLQKKVGGVVPPVSSTASGTTEAVNLEDSMRKAQEDAEILKSVVMPLEQEIQSLRNKLRNANLQSKEEAAGAGDSLEERGEGETKDTVSVNSSLLDTSELDEKVKELNQHLETEKSSRTDLEMYVAVLNTQKSVLQDEVDKLRLELQQVCRLLERERRELTDLKQTWQMANDQFLEAQRLMIADLRCMESVLTTEQQRQVEAEAEILEKQQADCLSPVTLQDSQAAASSGDDCKRERKLLLASLTSDELIKFDEEGDDPSLSLSTRDTAEGETKSLLSETGSIDSADKFSGIPCLSEVMQKAITDPTPEAEASKMLVATVNSWKEPTSLAGRRLVSEKEWDLLQKELKAAREKLGRSCDMCSNYESQLQALQENEKKAWSQVRTLERQLQAERQARTAQHSYVEQLETALHDKAEDARKQIVTLASKVADAETYIHETKHRFLQSQTELQQQLKSLTEHREEIHKELTRLQEENDTLVGKHSVHSQLMQEESIDLPNKIEDMQLLLLKYREDIITAKIAKEQTEESLHSQMLFLRDRVMGEQQEKARLEETLTQEISALQEALVVQQSVKSELDRQSTLHNEAENRVREADLSLKTIQAKSKQLTEDLQGQLEQHADAKRKLESEVQQLKLKLQSLQTDYDNSEAVQQDFVKLSQSLQIQLEKIRGAEHEVRWQHEEDVDDCTKCHQAFSYTRRKHHCRHCGKIFCVDCLNKTVNSGPNLRAARVCDVCHTILVQEATPFFSTQGGLHTTT
ncbi:Rab GTPase-binding effector protein 1 [Lamellibrachia satsuma]|nr:Rab GTPase-binding effector protein 1 [Lamellibrachia satsuma]